MMRRTQIYLDEEQHRLLADRATDSGTTKSELIRDAIDRYLGRDDLTAESRLARWRQALATSFGTAKDLPAGADYVRSLRDRDLTRLDEGPVSR